MVAPMHERAGLAAENHPLGRAHAGPVVDPLLDEIRRHARHRSRIARDVHCITRHRFRYRHSPHEPLELDDVVPGDRVENLGIFSQLVDRTAPKTWSSLRYSMVDLNINPSSRA